MSPGLLSAEAKLVLGYDIPNVRESAPMDTQAQTELEQLRAEIAELRKALSDKQQLEQPNLPALRDNFEFVTDMARFSEQLEATPRKICAKNGSSQKRIGRH